MKISLFITILTILTAPYALANEASRFNEKDWGVDPSVIDVDDTEYGKTQFRDLTDWKNINASDWTDLSSWKKQRAAKDKMPKWRTLVRNTRASEIIGKVLKCIGNCKNYKGLDASKASSLTTLREGDEFQTDSTATAWITLVDGTLLRVSPSTSITFNEVNLSHKEIFYLIRLNSGHFQFQSRLKGEFSPENRPETDMAFSPLSIKEANREYFSIKEYAKFTESDKFKFSIVENPGYLTQYQTLNKNLNTDNHVANIRDSKIFFYTANLSILSKNMNGAIFYTPRGSSSIKLSENIEGFSKNDKRSQSAEYQLRGYDTSRLQTLTLDKWFSVNTNGTGIREIREKQKYLSVAEAFLKRIPSIQMAREIFLDNYFKNLLDPELDSNKLARDFGTRLWNANSRPEMFLRETYLKEYIRRTETTNLKSMAKIIPKESDEKFGVEFIEGAMKDHYSKLRSLYSKEHMAVREMTENEYYLWLIRND